MSFFAELRRRSVFKVGAAYVVVGWLVIQIATSVFPAMDLPAWSVKLVVMITLLGLPVALVLAWALDMTPDGIKITSGAGNKRFYSFIAILMLAAIGWYWYGFHRAPSSDLSNARSIAVLPFVNMSGDKDNEYFSDGISEEILNVLAEVPELKVAARTSSFSFKGSKEEVPQIAKELGVRMVLEGSVRKQSDNVRITAQLIDASTGYHVWSQTYDRELKNIFAIQDEIAKAIGAELKLRVAGDGKGSSHRGTENLQAYDLYLRGVAQWQMRTPASLESARDSFTHAIAADPKFAQAWGGLALVYAVLPDYSATFSTSQATVLGHEAAERALILDPTMPEVYAALADYELWTELYPTAIALLERAIELRPSFATAHQWLGTTLGPVGEVERGLAALKRATELDPRSVIVANNYAWILMIAGRNSDAIAACMPSLDFAPDSILCPFAMAQAYLMEGHPDQARLYFDRVAAHSVVKGGAKQVQALFDALAGRADRHAFAVKLCRVADNSANDPDSGNLMQTSDIPVLLVLLGEHELALDYIASRPPSARAGMSWGMLVPTMDPVRCDPRFLKTIKDGKLKDLRAATVCKGTN